MRVLYCLLTCTVWLLICFLHSYNITSSIYICAKHCPTSFYTNMLSPKTHIWLVCHLYEVSTFIGIYLSAGLAWAYWPSCTLTLNIAIVGRQYSSNNLSLSSNTHSESAIFGRKILLNNLYQQPFELYIFGPFLLVSKPKIMRLRRLQGNPSSDFHHRAR